MSGTPGPWRIERGGGHAHNGIYGAESIQTNGWPRPHGGISNASYSDRVCENLGDLDLPGPAANARLIASVHDLLALAMRYADECGDCGGTGAVWTHPNDPQDAQERPCGTCADIRAVIDRIEGRTP